MLPLRRPWRSLRISRARVMAAFRLSVEPSVWLTSSRSASLRVSVTVLLVGVPSGTLDAIRVSDVEVERELPRVGPQADGVDLGALVGDPGVDQVAGEDVALEQERVVALQLIEHDVQRTRELLDLLGLLRRQLVEVLVHRLARIDLVRDPVEAGHQAGRERQVRVAG